MKTSYLERKDLNIGISVGLACNMRHNFCYQSCFSNERLSDEILYSELKDAYRHAEYISVLGGEITIIEGMKDYLTFVRRENADAVISIVTNGLAFDESWLELCKENKITVNFSLDASSEKMYATLIDTKYNPFNKIYNNFLRLLEASERDEIILNCISMVVSNHNADDIESFIRLALKHGINVQILYSNNDCIPLTDKIEKSIFRAIKLKEFCKEYIDIRLLNLPNTYCMNNLINVFDMASSNACKQEKEKFLEENPYKKARQRYSEWSFSGCSKELDRCILPWNGIYVMYNGDVMPCCCMTNYIVGNLYQQRLDEILESEYMKNVRNAIKNNDYSYCWEKCRLTYKPCAKEAIVHGGMWAEVQKLFDDNNYEEYCKRIVRMKKISELSAKLLYQYAFANHLLGRTESALEYYNLAEQKGFNEFWVKYNRGSLLLDRNPEQKELAILDIKRAFEIDPNHEGIRILIERISKL